MLPAPLRMRRSEQFARTIRTGGRAGRDTLVVHCAVGAEHDGTQVGFVVAKTVGGAVVRNVVRRRLRGVVLEQRAALPEHADVVVRALPASADATYTRLADDFRSALATAHRRGRERAHPGTAVLP
ncbi:ribonuclease P protein component [Cellulomonas carbonis]|uniref:Ribonuclease P protein component n=1 Tax=Cellulomonas carbonis T26 TaxID=947969 RepID=A0A0A0BWI8_9CELL|nr:ribonuclease P protein component [Cellulomonas carbonis]KGM12266.1 ribonuclease P [Cellulomonas carbonis T26]GGC01170.1 ribonuclease P protein component [Cellulomonas carbonis]